MNISVGENIKQLRMKKGITQEQLSEVMNVTCAAVSKWERGETYPDITMLQPLAFYFDVSLDELMGYNREKIETEIENVIKEYKKHWLDTEGRNIIIKAYRDYPNDYRIMHYYMWNIGGDMADNDSAVLLEHRDEFLSICDKILEGCTDEEIRLNAWNMRAKILHAEGKTKEALDVYNTKFADWFSTKGQKAEQLFSKGTDEYYFYVRKNMYELAEFAGDKFGRSIFFGLGGEHALKCGDILINAYQETKEVFFLLLAVSLLERTENDLCYRGGTAEQVANAMDKCLFAIKMFQEEIPDNEPLKQALDRNGDRSKEFYLVNSVNVRSNAKNGRRKELLKNPEYKAILAKYQ